jgi:putative membrane protein
VTVTETEPMGKPVPASAAKDDEAIVTTTPATPAPPAQASVSQEAREFVRKAAIGGLFEVQSSQLAVERATSPALQDTAKMLIRDHQQANDQLRSIATSKGISVPTTLDSEHQRMMDDLRNLQSDSFDKEFHRMQVDAHEKAIDLFEDAGENLKEPELKDFAQKTLPTLKAHLDELNANPVGG